MKKKIILIGMMGCGKTTTGKAFAEKGYRFADIDEEIEKSTQKKISEIFLRQGEPLFRHIESEKIKQLCTNENIDVISTGGGAFEDENNRNVMFQNGYVIYLKTTPQEIYNRIKNETHRPLLRKDFSVEKIASLLEKREKNYKKADIIIDTTGKTPYNVMEEIIGALK